VPPYATFDVLADNRAALGMTAGGPTGQRRPEKPGDTTHLDAADAAGNFVAATPSGGWISTSPVIDGLGFPLGTRGQMFYLNPARPNCLQPGKRPRCTLTPTIVMNDRHPMLAFGMRGGDGQDQWTLQFFLNHVDFGMGLQQALDAPVVMIEHMPSSFYPRAARPGGVQVDKRIDPAVIEELRRRGHLVDLVDNAGMNMMAIRFDAAHDTLQAAVRSTGQHAMAMGW
jgi:gamma-glutamyltranspeptidase/glutathione hydrolase